MSGGDSAFGLDSTELLELFAEGEMEIEGRMPYSSNATYLVTMTQEVDGGPTRSHRAIYKPGRGERPLWDFPPDLYKREVATYRLATAMDLDVIPPTTIGSGPMGEGSIQAFVDADFAEHYFTMQEAGVGLDDLRRLCALDLVANNTDRKSGHCLLAHNGRVYGIELSRGMLDVARRRLGAADATTVALTIDDARALCFRDEVFDAVFMSFTLELFDTTDIPVVLAEVNRVLRPAGRLGVVGMAHTVQTNTITDVYQWLHRHFPHFVDCRPIDVAGSVERAGFHVTARSAMSFWGLFVASIVGVKRSG